MKKISNNLAQMLLEQAHTAREAAYAPYSSFPVGASVLTADGRIFTGCNVENASFGASMCAERVAIFTAVAAGQRQIECLAVIADTTDPVVPCGLCLQVLAEFSQGCRVIMANLQGKYKVMQVGQLLPMPFNFR